MPSPSSLQQVLRLMQARNWPAAAQACRLINAEQPENAAGWLAAGQIALAQDRLRQARDAAAAAQLRAGKDSKLWDAIGTVFSRANDQVRALAAYDRALTLAPDQPRFLFNRATVHRFLGQLAQAEADYDRVIARRPSDYEAWRNRSELRSQTPERNHVAALEQLAAQSAADWRATVQLQYALAKEYEDLAQYPQAFQCLQRGARARREHMRYDVANDVATVEWIIEAFQSMPTPPAGSAADAPIFILGLPRSGSTLVERILSSHSRVRSAGELRSLALAIVDAAQRRSGRAGAARRELIAAAAQLDFAALGADYLERARLACAEGDHFIDKMPLNYLYCGWIRSSLPNARIVHVHRRPMAACYAIYKTLFEDAYPFSYDLTDIGRYYLGYRRLMEHWQRIMPEAILSLSYEALITDQFGESRRLLQFCGLDWEPACAEFHRNPEASTTASAAQVRRPLYDSSVSQWRHYELQLAELRALLIAGGIHVE
ncbi:MAG TPA: sulfotransferase [Steroidobacteraceae bacterium]|nr:sulfotransferase [Steroidobacteraceae bacterium]